MQWLKTIKGKIKQIFQDPESVKAREMLTVYVEQFNNVKARNFQNGLRKTLDLIEENLDRYELCYKVSTICHAQALDCKIFLRKLKGNLPNEPEFLSLTKQMLDFSDKLRSFIKEYDQKEYDQLSRGRCTSEQEKYALLIHQLNIFNRSIKTVTTMQTIMKKYGQCPSEWISLYMSNIETLCDVIDTLKLFIESEEKCSYTYLQEQRGYIDSMLSKLWGLQKEVVELLPHCDGESLLFRSVKGRMSTVQRMEDLLVDISSLEVQSSFSSSENLGSIHSMDGLKN